MDQPRQSRHLRLEYALLLGVLALFVAGSVWVATSAGGAAAEDAGSWVGGLPHLGLPLLYALLSR